jgi:hypothetical protein
MDPATRITSLINNFHSTSDLKARNDLLRQLKLTILTFKSLPPTYQSPNVNEFILAREIFELEMENSLVNKIEKEFELAYMKVKQFYFDYK